jgi:hypothetical protein
MELEALIIIRTELSIDALFVVDLQSYPTPSTHFHSFCSPACGSQKPPTQAFLDNHREYEHRDSVRQGGREGTRNV